MLDQTPIVSLTVEEVLTRWPQTAEVFNQHNMACVGCPVAPFYSIAEAVAVYQLSLDEFAAELQAVVREQE